MGEGATSQRCFLTIIANKPQCFITAAVTRRGGDLPFVLVLSFLLFLRSLSGVSHRVASYFLRYSLLLSTFCSFFLAFVPDFSSSLFSEIS